MKEQLILLAKEKGFKSDIIGKSVEAVHTDKDFYYLWMCELQKWIWKTQSIWVQSQPIFTSNECIAIHVTISSWRFPVIEVDYNGWNVYEGLEKGLQEALKLIKLKT